MRSSKAAFPIEGDLAHTQAGGCYSDVVDRLLTVDSASRHVLVTSPGPSEGKTVTAVNLALALHSRRIPVLLAELSLKHPKFAEIFGPSPLPRGMEDVITRDISLDSTICVRNDNNLNVSMVNKPQKTNDLLMANKHLDRLLHEARERYEWTIFDSSSIESTPGIRSIAARMGIVVLVVRARQTSQKALNEAIVQIAHPNTVVLVNDE